jgi:hypothetical protein
MAMQLAIARTLRMTGGQRKRGAIGAGLTGGGGTATD